jgi:hypothetical protein
MLSCDACTEDQKADRALLDVISKMSTITRLWKLGAPTRR